ncbi:MAG: response regulator transcription factor [Propionivibrio sp.]
MKIAYLEDDVEVAATVGGWLRDAGYEVECFASGVDCARAVASEHFDACLFDWMVPDLPGTEVLARLQIKLRQAMPPVIFATGRDSEADVVDVLSAGADDYIVKPLSRPVLLARLQAVLRRRGGTPTELLKQDFGSLSVDHGRRQFVRDGKLLTLTERETDLALHLFQNIGRLLTREHLIKVVWALTPDIDTRTIDVHVSTLRRKIGLTPEFGWRLVSIYGYGYRLERYTDPQKD